MREQGVLAFEQSAHSPVLNLNDLGFNYSLQATVRAKSGDMVETTHQNVKLLKSQMWDEVKQAVADHKPQKLSNISVLRTALLQEIMKADGKEARETYIDVRGFRNTWLKWM